MAGGHDQFANNSMLPGQSRGDRLNSFGDIDYDESRRLLGLLPILNEHSRDRGDRSASTSQRATTTPSTAAIHAPFGTNNDSASSSPANTSTAPGLTISNTSSPPEKSIKDLRNLGTCIPNYRGFIHVRVGPDDAQVTFDVHESLITARSPFFAKAMSGDWKEAQTRIVKLPDDEPDIFKRYIHLLYTNDLVVSPATPSEEDPKSEDGSILAKLYILAEKLQGIKAKNAVVQACILSWRQTCNDGQTYVPGRHIIGLIYNGTPTGALLRKLVVDIYTYRANSDWLKATAMAWPSDFINELALNLLDKRTIPTDPTMTGDISAYVEDDAETST